MLAWQRSGDPQRVFRARYLAARWRGRWQGIELGWSWDSAAGCNGRASIAKREYPGKAA
jgi:hypothetical protein